MKEYVIAGKLFHLYKINYEKERQRNYLIKEIDLHMYQEYTYREKYRVNVFLFGIKYSHAKLFLQSSYDSNCPHKILCLHKWHNLINVYFKQTFLAEYSLFCAYIYSSKIPNAISYLSSLNFHFEFNLLFIFISKNKYSKNKVMDSLKAINLNG